MTNIIFESIDNNLLNFYKTCAEHPNVISTVQDSLRWVQSTKGEWPYGIYYAEFKSFNIARKIKKVKESILKKRIPNAWTVGPMSRPRNLGAILEKIGFKVVYQQTGMAAELSKLGTFDPKINDFTITQITHKTLLTSWIDVVSNVFNIQIDKEMIDFLFSKSNITFFIGNYKNEYVCALILYISSNEAGLHAVSTIPKYRGLGLALKISNTALQYAFNLGIEKATLHASIMGEMVYTKLGFKKYCDIYTYALPF
ncbi:MAG: GNAT family N-acetyltransferase [Candidatus Thorarchaeota archaeon]